VVQSVKQNPASIYMFGNWYGCCCVVFLDFSEEVVEGRVSVMMPAVIWARDAYRTKGTIQGTTGSFEYLGSKERNKIHLHPLLPAEAIHEDRPEGDKGYAMIGKWSFEVYATYFSTSLIAASLLVCLRDRSTQRHCGSPSIHYFACAGTSVVRDFETWS
jgi:hypothetical protein